MREKSVNSNETSKPWASKTLWVGVIVAIAPFFPPAQAMMIANPEIAGIVVGGVFSILRMLNGKTLPMVGASGKPLVLTSPGAAANLDKK